jgi:hypothetical protein
MHSVLKPKQSREATLTSPFRWLPTPWNCAAPWEALGSYSLEVKNDEAGVRIGESQVSWPQSRCSGLVKTGFPQ